MAISTTIRKIQFDVSGGFVASYPFAFKFWAGTEIKATLSTPAGDVALTYGVDFSISTPGDSGTLTRIITAAWVSATRLTIYRVIDLTQPSVLANGGVQDAELYMQIADRNVAMAQESDEVLDRLVRFPITDLGTAPDLPDAETRKGLLLGFDNLTGDPKAVAASVGPAVVTPYMATVLDDATALEALKTFGILKAGATATPTSGVQDFLASTPPAGVNAFLASGASADVTYSGATVDLNVTSAQAAIQALGGIVKQTITDIGLTYVPANVADLYKRALIGNRHGMGEFVYTNIKQTPSVYNPIVDRSINQDISVTNYPTAIAPLRAEKLSILGVEDFNVTVTGSNVVFTDAAVKSQVVGMVISEAVVSAWKTAGQPATVPAADFSTAATQQCLTIAGVDYLITGATLGTWTIATSVAPPSGAQVCSLHPCRIVGDTTKARLLSLSGFVGVVAGEADGKVINGKRMLDTGQGWQAGGTDSGKTFYNIEVANNAPSFGGLTDYSFVQGRTANKGLASMEKAMDNGSDGVPRTDKNTSPRTIGAHCYQWLQVFQ